MDLPEIERIRLALLQNLVAFGYYQDDDLLTTFRSLGIPALLFERDHYLPVVERTTLVSTLEDDTTAHIDHLAISPLNRSNGLGTAIYSMLELALVCEGVNRVTLEAKGIDQVAFWTKNGFYQISECVYEKVL